jgi:hypothetical protein
MSAMESTFWDQLAAGGHKLPDDKPLAELTSELTEMLGDTDSHRRDDIAYPTLATWIGKGVYDDLLGGLGDGMAAGLTVGLGHEGADSVFRRSFSVLVLAACIRRDNEMHLVPADKIMQWGDRIAGWFVREQDLRGFVPGKGWAHAVAHGADAIGVLAESEAMSRLELTVLLDVLGDRLVATTPHRFGHGEDDRLASATMRILRRDVLGLDVLEPWLARVAQHAVMAQDDVSDPFLATGNVQAYLRALYLQLSLAPRPPSCRADLLLSLIDALKQSNPYALT